MPSIAEAPHFPGVKTNDRGSNPLNPFCFQQRMLETSLATLQGINKIQMEMIQLTSEGNSSMKELAAFKNMGLLPKSDPDYKLYTGEHVKSTDHIVFVTQGFAPNTKDLIRVVDDTILAPSRDWINGTYLGIPFESNTQTFQSLRGIFLDTIQAVSGVRSNQLLDPLREWFERWGNTAYTGVSGENTLQTENLIELIENVREAKQSNPQKKLVLVGVSAGGMLSELAADYLLEQDGILVDLLITAGSPEINPETTEAFNSMPDQTGPAGLIHQTANACMEHDPQRGSDPELSRLQEIMTAYAKRGKKPDIKKVAFKAKGDIIVPDFFSPSAIEIPGHHATMVYGREFLRTVSQDLLSTAA